MTVMTGHCGNDCDDGFKEEKQQHYVTCQSLLVTIGGRGGELEQNLCSKYTTNCNIWVNASF